MSLKLNERYPGRFNNPSADYPGGSFKNRTTPDAKDGSYLEKDWANDKEGFFQSLLSAAGINANGAVDKVGASQFFDALQQLKQNQSGVAFTTTGPSAALVLAPTPAITAYAAGQRFRVKFNRTSTGADTINVSGKGPLSLKQYDALGAKVPAVFAIDQLADVEYDGTDAVILDQLPANALMLPSFFLSGFAISNNATTPLTTVDVGAGTAIDSTNTYSLKSTGVISGILQSSGVWAAGSGANKLDTGVRANNTWYHVHVIRKTTDGSVDVLFSLSATAPTMPAGYSGFKRVGSVKTDGSGNIRAFSCRILPSGRRIFSWTTPILDINQVTLGTAATLYTLSVPFGVVVLARLNTFAYANNSIIYFCDPATTTLLPANGAGYTGFTCGYGIVTDAATDALASQLTIMTNTSSQIGAVANSASNTVSVLCLGWEE